MLATAPTAGYALTLRLRYGVGIFNKKEYALTDDQIDKLITAADIVTAARTGVERDYRGEILDAHALEMPTRFAKQLGQVVRGAMVIGATVERAMRLEPDTAVICEPCGIRMEAAG